MFFAIIRPDWLTEVDCTTERVVMVAGVGFYEDWDRSSLGVSLDCYMEVINDLMI